MAFTKPGIPFKGPYLGGFKSASPRTAKKLNPRVSTVPTPRSPTGIPGKKVPSPKVASVRVTHHGRHAMKPKRVTLSGQRGTPGR